MPPYKRRTESYYLLPEIAARVVRFAKNIFRYSGFAQINVPTYPTGLIGCCVGSEGGDVREPREAPEPELRKVLRYYSPEIHRGAFLLPRFASRLFEGEGK